MQAAQQSGAHAVHPGYGFLSESAEMVAAVEAAGLTWLGPTAASIRDFALKHVAKDMAVAAGVPTLSGSPLVTTEGGECSPFPLYTYISHPMQKKDRTCFPFDRLQCWQPLSGLGAWN